MQPPGSKVGAEIEKVAWVMFFFNPRGMGEEAKTQEWGAQFLGGEEGFSCTQNPIIEIYLGTLQPRDFPYLRTCFIPICKTWYK